VDVGCADRSLSDNTILVQLQDLDADVLGERGQFDARHLNHCGLQANQAESNVNFGIWL
jgi:hypothetical protein